MNTKEFIDTHKVVAIIRKVYGQPLLDLCDALFEGGVKLIECTFDQQDPDCIAKTQEAISALCARHGNDMMFGAGTVLTPEQVDAAHQAGAKYIISPNVRECVIRRTKELGMVSMPGAMTPSEIMDAHCAGADFVKLFPATTLGFTYIKDILAPISHVKLVATGGVTEENFGRYLDMGFAGAGISGRLADKKLMAEGNWAEITRRARTFAAIAKGELR
ncbi:bifunctional 4-hydroxy-2-oxoglutarate aldolase/2-dehydro-3-deoxy-phosphogluconate aldolase [Pseudoflavonifractor sp. 60]|uniref:bifunctional 4-hydroxy-2-oxoglutarate aldolase/2-dehydro-3-deoxy-phosphogluconate aldolase n=1 Tax=Pseudoflavonifractor sp. 60 TaxID=2304576 RepID=UPI00136C4F3F|nr:bifunctional 4-hydroxy-2-oxoglutarate aldolase/2-dehydro-3-deoxy-phosphogluconate aldolase [Pseudoflavonifractor sp. 60]NBI67167.1 bifunctional 4-hydroxy-2-oxoglutarate aldolase/2-dehydro-3-deoxy-phosphogluconate aldolase [Pseudoflavonifractor sp. 60]